MLLQTKEAAELLSMDSWQVQSFAKQGFVEPAVKSQGAGSRRSYDIIGLVKLAIIKRLTDDGFDLRTIRPIFTGLFEIPVFTREGDKKHLENVRAWFKDKILITARKFQLRKLVRLERLTKVIEELSQQYPGLYFINLGVIVEELIGRIATLRLSKTERYS